MAERVAGSSRLVRGARSVGTRSRALASNAARLDIPWARCGAARAVRATFLSCVLGPMMDFYVRRRTSGAELFDDQPAPVVFVANHSSHLDTPAILRALPRRWRQRTAVAAAADYFYKSRAVALFVSLIFNTVPIARRGGGLEKGSTDHLDRLLDQRWNLLLYPEGTRSRDGHIGRLRSGAAVIAAQHGLRIVPIRVSGTHEAMPPGRRWPHRLRGKLFSRRHPVEVRFGAPITLASRAEAAAAMEQVRAFFEAGAADGGHNGLANGSARTPVAGVRQPN